MKKRLLIEVNKDLHQDIKNRAKKKGMTIRRWLLIAIARQIIYEKDNEYQKNNE